MIEDHGRPGTETDVAAGGSREHKLDLWDLLGAVTGQKVVFNTTCNENFTACARISQFDFSASQVNVHNMFTIGWKIPILLVITPTMELAKLFNLLRIVGKRV